LYGGAGWARGGPLGNPPEHIGWYAILGGAGVLKRLLKSISAYVAGQVLNIVGNFVLVPLFLSRWSAGTYGEWMALSAVVAYFGVTDLGMNSAAGNAMTAAYARGDIVRYRHLQASAMAFYVGTALSASLLAGLLVALLPVPAWLGIRHIPPVLASWVTWLLAARLLWQMPAAQLAGIYRSTGNLATTQWFGNLQSVGLTAVTAVLLLLHGGVWHLAFWGALPMIVATAAVWLSLRRSHPELLPRLSEASTAGLKELLRPSLLFGLIMFSNALIMQGPVVLVSMVLGGTAVAVLATTRILAYLVRQMVAPVQVALWPEVTRLYEVGAGSALRLAHRLLLVGSVALSGAVAGALWFEGAEVMAVWTRGKLPVDVHLLRLLLLAVVLQSPWFASSLFAVATNRHRRLAYSYFFSGVFTLVAIALLIRPYGPLAVPLGGIIGEALACYHFVIQDACVVLGEEYFPFALRLWSGVAAMCSATWCAGLVGHAAAVGPAPFRWLQVGVMTTLAAALTAWSLAIPKGDRSRLVAWGKTRWKGARAVSAELSALPQPRC
jgi:O-antigen/teichoic acid export membrane protein